jgi:hypothetical protein
MNKVLPLNRLLIGLLLHQPGVWVDHHMVLYHLPRDPSHLWWLLGKHINFIPEEGDEHEFLFVAKIPSDVGDLGGIHANLDDFHGDVLIIWGLHVGCWWWYALARARQWKLPRRGVNRQNLKFTPFKIVRQLGPVYHTGLPSMSKFRLNSLNRQFSS